MIHAFFDCTIDPATFALHRKGRTVRIEPRVFDVLMYLIAHRERVVTKLELLDALWPGEAVSDSVLPRCIAAARRAVGDTRTRQRVIQTVHGRGYRFVAPLVLRTDEPVAGPAPSGDPPTPAREPERPDASGDAPFIGRVTTRARLRARLDRARAGRGSVTLLVGEPGIGKTRLCDEIAATAADAGFQVRIGRCYEGDGAPAYWPWIQILRESIAALPDDVLGSELGAGASDLAALVPELPPRLGAPNPASGQEGDQARFRLFDAATRHLVAAARRTPLLLVLDDLHWADASSLGLLRFLAAQIADAPLFLLATYRDVDVRRGHPLADLLGALARDPRTERVALAGFEANEIEAFLRAEAGAAPDRRIAERLQEMTDGNPFFLREIVKLLAEEHDLASVSLDALHALSLPQGIRDVVGRRLDALSEDCNRLLRSAAVLGRSFSSGVLRATLGLAPDGDDDEGFLEWLGEALDGGAIVETGHGRYAFTHALTRQTLYEELRAPQRIGLHRRAVRALEATLPPDAPGRLDELAHHAFEAAPGGDVERAIHYAVAAAEAAHAQHAYDEARHHYERAREALELMVPVPIERRLELELAAAEERFIAGDRLAAQERFAAVATTARSAGLPRFVARAAVGIFGYGEMGYRHDSAHVALLHESLGAIGDGDPVLRARLLARLAGTTMDDTDARIALAEESLALARGSGDPVALCDALGAAWWASLGPDRVPERFEIAAELEALAERTGDPTVALLGLESLIGACLLLGDAGRLESALARYEAIAAELRMPIFIFMAMMFRVSCLMNAGEFDRAEALREEAIRYGRGRIAFAPLATAGQLQWSKFQRGREQEGRDESLRFASSLEEFFQDSALSTIFSAVITRVHHGGTGLDAAQLASIDPTALSRNEHWLLAMGMLADAAYELDDRAVMEQLYAMLWPYRELMVTHDLIRTVSGSVWACLGELASGLARHDDAVAHYERAIEREEAAGLAPAALASRAGLARACMIRGGPGDAERAVALRDRVSADSAARGFAPSARSQSRLEALVDR